jgi:hypothetical protein
LSTRPKVEGEVSCRVTRLWLREVFFQYLASFFLLLSNFSAEIKIKIPYSKN